MNNPEHESILAELSRLTKSKSVDYSSSGPDENFERSAIVSSWFKSDIDKSFIVLISTKLARLSTLLNNGIVNKPNNESIDDSFLDLANYCILWAANYRRRIK